MTKTERLNTRINRLRVAWAFIDQLEKFFKKRPWIIPKIVTLNMLDEDKSCCHTHDFCDANQLMLWAFEKCNLPCPADEGYINDDHYTALWTGAWDIANAADFNKRFLSKAADLLWLKDEIEDLITSGLMLDVPFKQQFIKRFMRETPKTITAGRNAGHAVQPRTAKRTGPRPRSTRH